MEGRFLIRTISLKNILSFGPNPVELPLEPLNVLIGPNASGKSNLIEVLSLLHAAPRNLQTPIREGGGVRDWLWKGAEVAPTGTVEATLSIRKPMPVRYRLSFTETSARFELKDEVVEDERPTIPNEEQPYFYYRYQEGHPVLNVKGEPNAPRQLMREDVKLDQSILSQRRDPDTYPELTALADLFEHMSFYREFHVGRHTPPRLPQQADLQQDRLLEDASNLGLVLNDLLNQPMVKHHLLERMRDFYPLIEEVFTSLSSGGTVQIFFHEKGLRHAVPATRLSDGSLRYLCLLALLCHPTPPPVICIEEPEVGLHPDVIPEIAKLLVEAAKRSQIFVTTHSDILVDALSDVPEAVIVCEKVDGATQLRRLEADELKSWLDEEYRLGELWTSGEIGGNRW